jgi:hypothetical protein
MHALGETEAHQKIFSQDSQCTGQNSNQAQPGYNYVTLPLQ